MCAHDNEVLKHKCFANKALTNIGKHAPNYGVVDFTYQNFIISRMVKSIGRAYILLDRALIEKYLY